MIIIAEIGVNHNGSLHAAHELIRQARLAGADIAKFQFYDPDKISSGSHPNETAYRHALSVQFGRPDAERLRGWCDEEGIEFMASVFDIERFEWAEALGVTFQFTHMTPITIEHQLYDRGIQVRLSEPPCASSSVPMYSA